MIELTERQHRAIHTQTKPVRVIDRQSKREYVLLRAEVYERLRKALDVEVVDPSFFEFEEIPSGS